MATSPSSASVEEALDQHGITNIIHLAALQVPFCRADPSLGARVNVVGTVNIFEAARRRADRIRQVVYTGSVGMFDAADADPDTNRLENDATAHPINLYGVYKQANEGTARVYWGENGVSSIGLRPMTVYGPGRDQGMTSSPTKAIIAAVLGRPATIGFSGRTLLQYADDVARTLLIASRSDLRGANAFNLGGSLVDLDDFVAEIDAADPRCGRPDHGRGRSPALPGGDLGRRAGGTRSRAGDAHPDGDRGDHRAVHTHA